MAGIRALYQEVADLYATVNKLHREMLDCHQAQKGPRGAVCRVGFWRGFERRRGLGRRRMKSSSRLRRSGD